MKDGKIPSTKNQISNKLQYPNSKFQTNIPSSVVINSVINGRLRVWSDAIHR